MFITEKKGPRQTKWPEPASEDARIAPTYGWDNRADVLEAIRISKEAFGGLTPDDKGLAFVYRLGSDFYAQAISLNTAVRLLHKYACFDSASGRRLSKADLELELDRAYCNQANPPGLKSLAQPKADDSWLDPDDEDTAWLEGGASVWPRVLVYNTNQNNATLTKTFLDERPRRIISSDGILYTLDDSGVWREISETELASEIRATDPDLTIDTARLLQMVRGAHIEKFTAARPFEWIDEPADAPEPFNLALFSNGVLDVESRVLRPHDGKLFATGFPDVAFDPDATCPTWLRFISEALDGSFHPTLQEFLGILLVPDNRYEKFLVLAGAKRAGKSTIARIAESLVGDAHTSSRMLNDLGTDHGLEGLLTAKLLSIPDASDAESSRRSTTLNRMKAITGNDAISINPKNKKMITAKVPARLLMSCNRIPKWLDDSGALAARMLILRFENSFEGREDRELFTKLRAELPGVALWALDGLSRLRANGGRFTVGAKGLAAVRAAAESQSPALRYAEACLLVTGIKEDFVPLEQAFVAYEAWATEESLSMRERRNRNDFKDDLIAALETRGVRYTRRRWRDPADKNKGEAERHRGFSGCRVVAGPDGRDAS